MSIWVAASARAEAHKVIDPEQSAAVMAKEPMSANHSIAPGVR